MVIDPDSPKHSEVKVARTRAFSPKDCMERPLPKEVVKSIKNNLRDLCEFLGEPTYYQRDEVFQYTDTKSRNEVAASTKF